jgi:hypothetical protein
MTPTLGPQDEVESFMLVFGAPMMALVGYAVGELRFESFRDEIPLDTVYKVSLSPL